MENELGLQDLIDRKTAMQQYLTQLPPKALGLLIRVVLVIVLYIIGSLLIKLIRRVVNESLKKTKIEKGSLHFIDICVNICLYIVLIVLLGSYFGLDAASVVTLMGSAALTLGLSFQGSLSNFAGGVLILVSQPFKVGDYIIERSTDTEGTVKEISLFYTKLMTLDHKMVIVPNGILSNTTLINASATNERRVDIRIGVEYSTDIDKAREVALKALEHEDVLKEGRQVFVADFLDSSMLLGIEFYVRNKNYIRMSRLMNENIKKAFDKAGIVIPFEQLDVHMV